MKKSAVFYLILQKFQQTNLNTNKMKDLKSEIVIRIEENSYTIKIASVGQLIDIENMKSAFAQSGFDLRSESGSYANLMNDAIATFSVLSPQIIKDLNMKSLYDLPLTQSKKIAKVYSKEFKPWWEAWIKEINTDDEEETDKSPN